MFLIIFQKDRISRTNIGRPTWHYILKRDEDHMGIQSENRCGSYGNAFQNWMQSYLVPIENECTFLWSLSVFVVHAHVVFFAFGNELQCGSFKFLKCTAISYSPYGPHHVQECSPKWSPHRSVMSHASLTGGTNRTNRPQFSGRKSESASFFDSTGGSRVDLCVNDLC